jgi:hypothetical protein
MNLTNDLWIALGLSLIVALIIAGIKFNKLLSKFYLTFLGLVTAYTLVFNFGGQKVSEWLLVFQSGPGNYVGIVLCCLTAFLAFFITIQGIFELLATGMGWTQNGKIKQIVVIGVISFCFFGFSSYVFYQQFESALKDVGKEAVKETMDGPGQVELLAMLFKAKYSRWPKNPTELQKYVPVKKFLDLTHYKNLTFKETPKGLKIHFDSYKDGNVSMGPTDEEVGGSFSPSK